MFRLDVTGSAELLAMVRMLRHIEPEWLKLWTSEGRAKIEPQWQQELEASRPNKLQRVVLVRSSRVALSRRAIQLKAGGVGKLKSGDSVSRIARGTEFGQDPNLKTRYVRKDKPTPAPAQHVVTRRTARPVGPRNKKGKVVWPALERFVPKAGVIAVELFYDVMRQIPGFK